MDGFYGEISNKKYVRVNVIIFRIINMSVVSYFWGKLGVI